MGRIPEWYYIIYAAKYLGVPPWELLAQPECWLDWAMDARTAEAHAEKK